MTDEEVPTAPVVSMNWEIQIEFDGGIRWVMPHGISYGIIARAANGAQQIEFHWDWDGTFWGTRQPDRIHYRYIIDFARMLIRNMDNGCTRVVKVVCIIR